MSQPRFRVLRPIAVLQFTLVVAAITLIGCETDGPAVDVPLPSVGRNARIFSSVSRPTQATTINGKTFTVENYPMGLLPPTKAEKAAMQTQSAAPASGVQAAPASAPPTSFDLTPWMPLPDELGQQTQSCAGWAAGYAALSYQEGRNMGWSLQTPDHLFSPSWLYNKCNGGKDSGASLACVLGLINNNGDDTLAGFPGATNDYTTQPNAFSNERASHFKLSSSGIYGWSGVNKDLNTFKLVISGGRPIMVGLNTYPQLLVLGQPGAGVVYDTTAGTWDFCSNRKYDYACSIAKPNDCTNNRGTCTHCTSNCKIGGHGITLIGYNDYWVWDDSGGGGAFFFINSWGNTWDWSGYGYISYDLIMNSAIGADPYLIFSQVMPTTPLPMEHSVMWAATTVLGR